ncbi:MAG: kelch repeat-containing protein [Longimicrobiales bacterium]
MLPGSWATAPPLPIAVREGAATAAGGRLYVAGGAVDDSTLSARAYAFDPASGWSRVEDLPEALLWPAAVAHGGTLLVLGGNGSPTAVAGRNAVRALGAADGTWSLHSALPVLSVRPLAVALASGALAVELGAFPSIPRTAARLPGAASEWVASAADLPPFPAEHLVSDGTVAWAVTRELIAEYRDGAWGTPFQPPTRGFVVGAWAHGGRLYVLQREATLATMQAWDPGAGAWESLAAPTEAVQRTGAMSAVLDGRLYLIGGRVSAPGGAVLDRVDVFTPPA